VNREQVKVIDWIERRLLEGVQHIHVQPPAARPQGEEWRGGTPGFVVEVEVSRYPVDPGFLPRRLDFDLTSGEFHDAMDYVRRWRTGPTAPLFGGPAPGTVRIMQQALREFPMVYPDPRQPNVVIFGTIIGTDFREWVVQPLDVPEADE
jgi:hypothetical protein